MNVALICEALATVTLLAVSPAPPVVMNAPEVKLFPVSVTWTEVPAAALAGDTEDKAGLGTVT